jgi:hypothetical protein
MKINYCIVLFTIVLFTPLLFSAQGLKNLDDNNGFKKHKLGSRYTSLYGVKSKQEDGSEKVVINSTADKIGDIPVKTIELYYLKDTLSRIIVRVSPEHHARLIEASKNSFGAPTQNLSDNETTRKAKNENLTAGKYYKDQYTWKSKRLNMEYLYEYPIVDATAYTQKDLHLSFTLNDYSMRLNRAKKGSYNAKDF